MRFEKEILGGDRLPHEAELRAVHQDRGEAVDLRLLIPGEVNLQVGDCWFTSLRHCLPPPCRDRSVAVEVLLSKVWERLHPSSAYAPPWGG